MQSLKPTTLRPGLLVSLKTSVVGNVSYTKRDIEAEHETADGRKKAVWETERTISDPAEHDEAIKVRSRVRSLITGVCSNSAFGLLCPENKIADLERAIAQARGESEIFNGIAQLTQVNFYIIAGKIAPDDAEAVRAINSEVRGLLSEMERGLQNLDVQVVRNAANKARSIGAMLSPDAAARIQGAIDSARAAARKIVTASEQGAAEIDLQAIKNISESRMAFLDIDDTQHEMEAPSIEGRAIDLAPSDEITLPTPASVPALELE